ncbi:MAG: aminoacyl-tRNA hydrolase [Gammaproteobacteria bacterium]|jgi:PTH1 family peptidyl-tRNA hydrolase
MTKNFPVLLIIGLANPGDRYKDTRHNAGSWFVETLLSTHNEPLKTESKFFAAHSQINIGAPIRVAIPTTYINESGKAAQALMQFFKIKPENVLIAYDDLDLPPGTVRLKQGGGTGGHNGLKSLVQYLGTQDFNRLRIGIGHPGVGRDVVNYVLGVPSVDDKISIMNSIDKAIKVLPLLAEGSFEKAMTQLHTE